MSVVSPDSFPSHREFDERTVIIRLPRKVLLLASLSGEWTVSRRRQANASRSHGTQALYNTLSMKKNKVQLANNRHPRYMPHPQPQKFYIIQYIVVDRYSYACICVSVSVYDGVYNISI